jgi:hypothetical protein
MESKKFQELFERTLRSLLETGTEPTVGEKFRESFGFSTAEEAAELVDHWCKTLGEVTGTAFFIPGVGLAIDPDNYPGLLAAFWFSLGEEHGRSEEFARHMEGS